MRHAEVLDDARIETRTTIRCSRRSRVAVESRARRGRSRPHGAVARRKPSPQARAAPWRRYSSAAGLAQAFASAPISRASCNPQLSRPSQSPAAHISRARNRTSRATPRVAPRTALAHLTHRLRVRKPRHTRPRRRPHADGGLPVTRFCSAASPCQSAVTGTNGQIRRFASLRSCSSSPATARVVPRLVAARFEIEWFGVLRLLDSGG